MVLDSPFPNVKSRIFPVHGWSEIIPIVLHRVREERRGRNPIAAGIKFQLRDELQFFGEGLLYILYGMELGEQTIVSCDDVRFSATAR